MAHLSDSDACACLTTTLQMYKAIRGNKRIADDETGKHFVTDADKDRFVTQVALSLIALGNMSISIQDKKSKAIFSFCF